MGKKYGIVCYRGPRTGVVFFFIGPVLPLASKGETWRAGSYCLGLNWCASAKHALFLGICHVILTKGEGVLKNTLVWKRQNNTLRPKKGRDQERDHRNDRDVLLEWGTFVPWQAKLVYLTSLAKLLTQNTLLHFFFWV